MINQASIFVWQGKVHLGDEPGIYGDAQYVGLAIESPLTIQNYDKNQPTADTIEIEILTRAVNIYDPGYVGHKIIIRKYSPLPGNTKKWQEQIIDPFTVCPPRYYALLSTPANGARSHVHSLTHSLAL